MPDTTPAAPEEAVERVARAIAAAGDSVFAWEQMPENVGNHTRRQGELLRARTRKHCRELARAALPAIYADLRERMLSDEAVNAGYDRQDEREAPHVERSDFKRGLRAALDTAMKGGGDDLP